MSIYDLIHSLGENGTCSKDTDHYETVCGLLYEGVFGRVRVSSESSSDYEENIDKVTCPECRKSMMDSLP